MSQAPGPLSLPFRMDQKKKRTRAGIAFVVVGVPVTGLGIFGFARGGAEMLGVWGLALGLALTVLGIVTLVRASKSR